MTATNANATSRLALFDQPTMSVAEFAHAVGISRASAYGMCHEGRVRHLRVGTRIVIPTSAVRELLDGPASTEGGAR